MLPIKKEILHPNPCVALTSYIPFLPSNPQSETLPWFWVHHFQEYFIRLLCSYILTDNISDCLHVSKLYINDTVHIRRQLLFWTVLCFWLLFVLIRVSILIIVTFTRCERVQYIGITDIFGLIFTCFSYLASYSFVPFSLYLYWIKISIFPFLFTIWNLYIYILPWNFG